MVRVVPELEDVTVVVVMVARPRRSNELSGLGRGMSQLGSKADGLSGGPRDTGGSSSPANAPSLAESPARGRNPTDPLDQPLE